MKSKKDLLKEKSIRRKIRKSNNPKKYRLERRERRILDKTRRPWVKHLRAARRRCLRGDYLNKVSFNLSIKEVKYVWIRDKAELLRKPSLDRIKTSGNYLINNIQFIEFSDNVRKRNIENSKLMKGGK